MIVLLLALVFACAVFVGADAHLLGVERGGLGGGFIDMGPVEWFIVVLLLWVVAFPLYLAYRPLYQQASLNAR